jgi:hypothetical protein
MDTIIFRGNGRFHGHLIAADLKEKLMPQPTTV